MKILHAVHGFLPEHDGGTERYVDAVARHQVEGGDEVVLAVGSYSDRYDGFVETKSPVASVAAAAPPALRIYRISQLGSYAERWDHGDQPEIEVAFARLVHDFAPDVVHVHHWLRLSRGIVRAARSCGVPVVWTAHDLTVTCPRLFRVREDDPFCQRPLAVSSCLHCVSREAWQDDSVVARNLEAYAVDMLAETRACTRVIAPSRAHASVVARFSNLPQDVVRVVPHPRTCELTPRRAAPEAKGARPSLHVAHWGHLIDYKGPHVLLDAMEGLARACPDARLRLSLWGRVDDEAYRERLERLLASLSSAGIEVERRATFTHDELCELDADVAVFPSLAHESWSFVVDEALALAMPVLVSERGAPPERVGDAGRSFAPGDARALEACLRDLLQDPKQLTAMRAACATAGTSLAAHAQALEAIYEEAIAEAPSALPCDFASKVAAARIRRSFEDRARWLDALRRSAEAEVMATRKDAELSFSQASQVAAQNAAHQADIALLVDALAQRDGPGSDRPA